MRTAPDSSSAPALASTSDRCFTWSLRPVKSATSVGSWAGTWATNAAVVATGSAGLALAATVPAEMLPGASLVSLASMPA